MGLLCAKGKKPLFNSDLETILPVFFMALNIIFIEKVTST